MEQGRDARLVQSIPSNCQGVETVSGGMKDRDMLRMDLMGKFVRNHPQTDFPGRKPARVLSIAHQSYTRRREEKEFSYLPAVRA